MIQEQSYLSFFTPSQMSHEMLEAILVNRQKLAARLVSRIKQSVLAATKHQALLLGPRGIGKSYLVALVYHRVKELPELVGKIAIAYFSEEEWSITSLTDLLLVILKALEREYGGLKERIEALYRLPVREVEQAAEVLIREFVGERTLFLLMENLDEIFRGLGEAGQWALRSFLCERPFATVLATTPSLFAGVNEQRSAFYGFFQHIYLEELTVEEATELLEKLAQRRADQPLADFLKTTTARERVQAIHDLAGGHPRIYLLFAHLLTQETLDELVTPFMKLLDELTPYYQSRMQLLSPQQRKIVEFLCSARGAVPVKEIATQNLITPQTASSQLDKLEEMAYVRKTPIGRESLYELREPLLRMVIEVKRGRGEPVRLIVDFLRRWYNRRERRERLSHISPNYPLTREYLLASLDLERAALDAPDWKRAKQFSSEFADCLKAEQYDRACELAEEIIERKGSACTSDDRIQYAYCLAKTEQCESALTILEPLTHSEPKDAYVWWLRGCMLGTLGNYSNALTSFDEALALYPDNIYALSDRGTVLMDLHDYPEALTSFSDVLALHPQDAGAWFHRAAAQLGLGHWVEFYVDLKHGFTASSKENIWLGFTTMYCQLLFHCNDFWEQIAPLVRIYAEHDSLEWLGQGVTKSIPDILNCEFSQAKAERWLAVWEVAGKERPELDIPLRLLAAAVEWKRTRSALALLTLPIEERRILESLLPKEEKT